MKQRQLLVIEDDPDIATIVCDVANEVGFKTHTAQTSKEIAQQYENIQPDVIILDLLMPDQDGFETLHFLSERCCTAHIVILSGQDRYRGMAEGLGRALGISVVDNISKPFRIADLRDKLRVIMSQLPDEESSDSLPNSSEDAA